MLETARAAFEASSQRVSLTNLSGRRDMSLLLALSATQVRHSGAYAHMDTVTRYSTEGLPVWMLDAAQCCSWRHSKQTGDIAKLRSLCMQAHTMRQCAIHLMPVNCYTFSNSACRTRQTDTMSTRLTTIMLILQPGVASVYCAIVQQTRDGCEFYIKDFPELAGCSYSEARRRLPDAVLYG